MNVATGWKRGCLALAAVAALGVVAANAQYCLIISEILDGDLPGGVPKFVEITNVGTSAVDLSNYSIGNFTNGAALMDYDAQVLTGVLAAGDSWVVSYEAGDCIGSSSFYDVYGFDADELRTASYINGNDAVVLFYGAALAGDPGTGSNVVDIYGVPGVDGIGTPWEYTDSYAYRNFTVSAPNPIFNASEWTIAGAAALDGADAAGHLAVTDPGSHSFTGTCTSSETLGACCVSGACTQTTEAACTGVFYGVGSTCSSSPCDPPTGACCCNGMCTDGMTESECDRAAGTWYNGVTCASAPCALPCYTIADAKAAGDNMLVQVCDVLVTNETTLVHGTTTASFQVEDSTGGLTVFGDATLIADILAEIDTDFLFTAEGYRVTLVGTMSRYNNLWELDVEGTAADVVIASTYEAPPVPTIVTGDQIADDSATAEDYESRLLTVRCATFVDAGNTFNSFSDYDAYDVGGRFVVQIWSSNNTIVGEAIPTGAIDITGVFQQKDDADPDNGYILMPRYIEDLTTATCLPPGACCFGTTCEIYASEAECTTAGGVYQGDGVGCDPSPCQITGACCIAGTCSVETPENCAALGGGYVGDATLCDTMWCAQPVEPGDVAYGLSQGNRAITAQQVRAGAKIGAWTKYAYIQSFEFDNSNDVLHNGQGNLLAVDYGSTLPAGGGNLYNVATDGSNRGELLYWFNTSGGAPYSDRIGGAAFSNDNAYLSVWGVSTLQLWVFPYDAGTTPGTGTGATLGTPYVYSPGGVGATQGTAFYWNGTEASGTYTILMHRTTNVPNHTELWSVDFDSTAGTFSNHVKRADINGNANGSQFTDVAYNPEVSPYVFTFASTYSGGSYSTLAAIDPRTSPWTVVSVLSLVPDMTGTGRSLAIGPDGYVYMSQYHSPSNLADGLYSITRIPAGEAAVPAWTTASVEGWYADNSSDGFSSYNGLDVASGNVGPVICPGDANCDGEVNFFDIDPFVVALTASNNASVWQNWLAANGYASDCDFLNNDTNGDLSVDFFDIDPFVTLLSTGATCP